MGKVRHEIEVETPWAFECSCGFRCEGDDSHYQENKHLALNLPVVERKIRLQEIESKKHAMKSSYHEQKYSKKDLETLREQIAREIEADPDATCISIKLAASIARGEHESQ